MTRKPRAANAYADIDAPLRPLPMAEALEFWRSKVPLSPREFYKLAEQYRVRAFTVSRLARADMLGEIYQSIEKALDEGVSFGAWKKSLAPIWAENGWTGVQAWRVDNIFCTNIQTAYNVGRYKQMMAVVGDRPYWQYSAVNDSRTRPTHRALHGRVYRADSPFWDTFYPPNGHRCRCKVKTLSARQVAQRGLEVREGNGLGELIEPIGPHGPEPARPLMPDKGFEGNPGKEAWEPDLSKYPDWLRAKLEAVLGRAPTPTVPLTPPTPGASQPPVKGASFEEFAAFGRARLERLPSPATDPDAFVDGLLRELDSEVGTSTPCTTASRGAGSAMVQRASRRTPDSWTAASDALGPLVVKAGSRRGYYSASQGLIAVRAGSLSNAVHEFAHRLQHALPELDDVFQGLHRARTAGDRLERLRDITGVAYSRDEVARKDKYMNPYQGKEYSWSKGHEALEVMSMGMETVLGLDAGRPETIANLRKMYEVDKEMVELVVGLLFGWKP